MKTLKEYAKEFKDNIQVPGRLVELSDEMASDYAYYSEEMQGVKLQKPFIWADIKKMKDGVEREKYLSDTLTEQCWRMQELGKKEIELKYNLKGLEKMMASIKSHIYIKNQESYNQY